MGKLQPSYKKAIISEIVDSITLNESNYYAFAACPKDSSNLTNTDYDLDFSSNWEMLFGKKLANTDIMPVIEKNIWGSGNTYSRYDNTSNTLHTDNNFYVITLPNNVNENYHIYKCIDNANNGVSTINPSTITNPTIRDTFTTIDNYKWKFITSINASEYTKFAPSDYFPIKANTAISTGAFANAGVEVVMIANGGSGYTTYTQGKVLGVTNTTYFELANTISLDNGFYNNTSIYFYNSDSTTSQILTIKNFIVSSGKRYVETTSQANVVNITANFTNYKITPRVVFQTDGTSNPQAYAEVDANNNYRISKINIFNTGSRITRANVSIITNGVNGSGANLYAIVPPLGGHGFDPVTELNAKGMAINFSFANTEGGTILTKNSVYSRIGIIKNPMLLVNTNIANVQTGFGNVNIVSISNGNYYTANTFNQLLVANVNPNYPHTFSVNDVVTGATTNCVAKVVYANSSQVYMIGDKRFGNNEGVYINSSNVTYINIKSRGHVYYPYIKPLYVQNINKVTRLDSQTESYKMIIEV